MFKNIKNNVKNFKFQNRHLFYETSNNSFQKLFLELFLKTIFLFILSLFK